jgi:hypothetical protein
MTNKKIKYGENYKFIHLERKGIHIKIQVNKKISKKKELFLFILYGRVAR